MSEDRPWTGPEKVRRALAISGGWEWCAEHRSSPGRPDGCPHPPPRKPTFHETAHPRGVMRQIGTVWVVARPLRDTSWWHRWKQERRCRKVAGHCWHPDGLVDWWCCMCSGETDGMPPERCIHCLAAMWDGIDP